MHPRLLLDAQAHDVRRVGADLFSKFVEPVCSIVMPMFRAASAISQSLPRLLAHTAPGCELLFLLDGSRGDADDPQLVALESILTSKLGVQGGFVNSSLHRVRIYASPVEMFETPSEAFLIEQSRATSHYISVQPDMMIDEPGWNDILSAPLHAFSDVFAVSGRVPRTYCAPFCFSTGIEQAMRSAQVQVRAPCMLVRARITGERTLRRQLALWGRWTLRQ